VNIESKVDGKERLEDLTIMEEIVSTKIEIWLLKD
jgi:hypothetical protein